MARIPDAFIDDLLARTDIVEVIGDARAAQAPGQGIRGALPFHDERSASFTVSPTKQFYHCFGCGAHGTAISFLMNYDRLEFLDAVDELAKRVGMEVPRDTRSATKTATRTTCYAALDAAAQVLPQATRRQRQGERLRRTPRHRAGDRRALRHRLRARRLQRLRDALGTDPRRMQLLERAGLFSKNDKGHVYDKFRDRLMFPIADRRGRTIAFGGRVLDPEDSPKYLNSPETPLFHKGRELYGLWQARQAQQQARTPDRRRGLHGRRRALRSTA